MLALLALVAWCAVPQSALAATSTVTYANRVGGPLRMDVYRPTGGATGRPVVIILHGGGWWSGTRAEMRSSALAFNRRGFVAVSIDYRLTCGTPSAPRGSWGYSFTSGGPLCGARIRDQVLDVQQAAAFVRARARSWGASPNRMAYAGSSAGGHLALLAAVTAPPASRVRAVVNWSGPPGTRFIDAQDHRQAGSIKGAFTNAVGCTLLACPAQWDAVSPQLLVNERTAKVAVLATGSMQERQVAAWTLRVFDRRARALGWRSEVAIVGGDCHSRGCLHHRLPGGQTVAQRSESFLASVLR